MRLRFDKEAYKKLENSGYLITKEQYPIQLDKNSIIEIGMGKGDMLAELALQNPEKKYYGIEKYATPASKILTKLKGRNINNLKIIIEDAKKINEIFKGECSEIWLTFSDPWPKNRHLKRRLTHENYLKIFSSILSKNSVLLLKTDNDAFYNFSLESLKENNWRILDYGTNLHQSKYKDKNVMTNYERKWTELGKNINFIVAQKPISSELELKIQKFKKWLSESKLTVFFSGAGVSTASGLPDFRSSKGLYSQKYQGYNPEFLLSRSFWKANLKLAYQYYFENLLAINNIKPNIIHKFLAAQSIKNNFWTITQNVDNLDLIAKNRKLIELHGNINRNYCSKCKSFFNLEQIIGLKDLDGIPHCNKCQGIIYPDVVLYEDPLNYDSLNLAIEKIAEADLLIIAGTQLSVYPAASLINYYNDSRIVILNKEPLLEEQKMTSKFEIIEFIGDMKGIFEKL